MPIVRVVRVWDGDTVDVVTARGSRPIRVRLWGIDAPELSQPFGPESRRHLQRLLNSRGEKLQLESYGSDRFGRNLGLLYWQDQGRGRSINRQMIEAGLTYWFNYNKRQGNALSHLGFFDAGRHSSGLGLGVWGAKTFWGEGLQAPWDYRASRREGHQNKPEENREELWQDHLGSWSTGAIYREHKSFFEVILNAVGVIAIYFIGILVLIAVLVSPAAATDLLRFVWGQLKWVLNFLERLL